MARHSIFAHNAESFLRTCRGAANVLRTKFEKVVETVENRRKTMNTVVENGQVASGTNGGGPL